MCFVTVPHPLGMISKEEVNAKVDAAFDDIVKAATAWTPSKEKQDAQVKPYPAKRFKFSGTYADVNDMFQKRKWSLSLPIVPPTVDKVAAMLKGTKRNPAEVLWVVPPRQGMLTVELVAALGVMAGAKPEHMPLLIATVEAMAAEGTPFTGILYAGLIATADGPKVIEFNARFGDPETEVVLPKLTSDLGAAISAILDGGTPAFTWDSDNATLGVVLASNGYPVNVIKGAKIPSIPVDDASHVYYAGVSNSDQGLVASSGRVLLIETTAPDLKSAQDKVYAIIDKLDTKGMFYRHDIGAKALK